MGVLSITFRIPGGEKVSEDRLERLSELGVETSEVSSERAGEISIRFVATEMAGDGELYAAGEEFSEQVECAFDDMTLLDMERLAQ